AIQSNGGCCVINTAQCYIFLPDIATKVQYRYNNGCAAKCEWNLCRKLIIGNRHRVILLRELGIANGNLGKTRTVLTITGYATHQYTATFKFSTGHRLNDNNTGWCLVDAGNFQYLA